MQKHRCVTNRHCASITTSETQGTYQETEMNNLDVRFRDGSIGQVCETLQSGAQAAETHIRNVDLYIEKVSALGLVNRTIITGPIVIRRGYGIDGPCDSGELIQAAISTEHGTAAVFWDSEDYAWCRHHDQFEFEAMLRARPLRECSPAIRAMVYPQVNDLLLCLINCIRFD